MSTGKANVSIHQSRRSASSAAAILAELVSIPSVHPEADAGGSRPGEAALADWVAVFLRSLGASVALRELAPGRPSVTAIFEPAGRPDATVLFMPHLDTVGVARMSVPPFLLTRGQAGRLHGRGACDTKGPMAALFAALAKWVHRPAFGRGKTRWIVAATAGEEQGSLGARQLFEAGLKADFAVALEPTGLKVVQAAKGVLRIWIDVEGKAAHGSHPERGVNAIYRSVPLVAAIESELSRWLASFEHPILGRATVNLGIMQGGSELNVVPSLCRLGLDLRLHPGIGAEQVIARLHKLIAQTGVKATVTVHRSGPAFVTSKLDPWSRRLRKAGRGWAVADWFCDANIAVAHGVPAVAFGPGHIDQAHTKNEYILTAELNAGSRAFLEFLSYHPSTPGR